MTQNQIAYQTLQETMLANRNREAETERSNRAQEDISIRNLEETHRSNVARELETNRSNLAREFETHRTNLANEAIGAANVSLRGKELVELGTHNREMEYVTDQHYIRQDDNQRRSIDSTFALGMRNAAQRSRELDLREQGMWVQLGADIGATGSRILGTLVKTLGKGSK